MGATSSQSVGDSAPSGLSAEQWSQLIGVGNRLAEQMREEDDLTIGFEFINRFVAAWEALPGETIDAVAVPGGLPAGFKVADLRMASSLIRAVVCENDKTRKEVEAVIANGLQAVAAVILAALAASVLTFIVVAIAVGMAAVIVVRGVDGICAHDDLGR